MHSPTGMKVSAPYHIAKTFTDKEFSNDKLHLEQLPESIELADRKCCFIKCNAKETIYNGFITALKAILFSKKNTDMRSVIPK